MSRSGISLAALADSLKTGVMPCGLAGVVVYTNHHLTRSERVRRSWRERLFSWPWRPWRGLKFITVPDEKVYEVNPGGEGAFYIMHPATWEKYKAVARGASGGKPA